MAIGFSLLFIRTQIKNSLNMNVSEAALEQRFPHIDPAKFFKQRFHYVFSIIQHCQSRIGGRLF
jgi:hypothetical protein